MGISFHCGLIVFDYWCGRGCGGFEHRECCQQFSP